MINRINQPIMRLVKKITERTQINKIRAERGEITADYTEIKGLQEISMSNNIPRNFETWVKWTNF